jgi:hypothetical protein
MSGCQPCDPADGVLIVSVRVLEYLCCLCGRHVAPLHSYTALHAVLLKLGVTDLIFDINTFVIMAWPPDMEGSCESIE